MIRRASVCKFFGCQAGVTAIEFAFVAPPFLLLIFGAVEYGRVLDLENQVRRVADVGARALLINQNATTVDLKASMQPVLRVKDPSLLNVTLQAETIDGVQYSTLEVTYPFTALMPIIAGSSRTITVRRRTPRA